MVEIALKLSGKTPSSICDFADEVRSSMTTNAAKFPTPPITMAELVARIAATRAAITKAESGSPADKQARDQEVEALVDDLETLAVYVELTAGDDEAWALLSGFHLRKSNEAVGPMPQVQNARAKTTGVTGEIAMRWKAVYGAKTYMLQLTTTPNVENSWAQAAISTKANCSLTGQPSLQLRYVRIAAIGTAGQGQWSDIVECYAR